LLCKKEGVAQSKILTKNQRFLEIVLSEQNLLGDTVI
jgi:hypothetical protein